MKRKIGVAPFAALLSSQIAAGEPDEDRRCAGEWSLALDGIENFRDEYLTGSEPVICASGIDVLMDHALSQSGALSFTGSLANSLAISTSARAGASDKCHISTIPAYSDYPRSCHALVW